MKNIGSFIQERLVINSKSNMHSIRPKDKTELRNILEERLAKDKDADLNDIDVSQIKDMSGLFDNLNIRNIKISEWNVSNVENMCEMFNLCAYFTGEGLENWNVSQVKNMQYMFYGCKHFNADLNKWDISNVKNMSYMFYDCWRFNSDLSKWDVSNARDMIAMFYNCYKFNSDLNQWNISNVKDMDAMFICCRNLKNIPNWYKE